MEGNGYNDNFNEEEHEDLAPHIQRYEEMLKNNASYFFDLEVFEAIIDHYLDNSKLQQAIRTLNFAISQHPNAISLLLKKAEIYTSAGKLNKALEILVKVGDIEPYNGDMYILRASIYSQQRNHKEAIKNLKLALQFCEDEKDDLLLDLAFEYESNQQYDKAILCLKEALVLNKENESALFEIAFCYDMSGKQAEGVEFFNQFIDENPYSFTAWYNLGNSYIRNGLFEKALESFDYCTAINDKFSSAYFNKANALVQLEKYPEAIENYKEVIQLEDAQAMTCCYIGECYEKLDDTESAAYYYQKAIDLDEEFSDAWVGLGIIHDMKENTQAALECLDKAVLLSPLNADHWFIFAEALEKAGQTERARTAYEKVIQLDINNIEAWLDYSTFVFENDNSIKAHELITEALSHHPENFDLLYRKVVYLIASSHLKEALVTLEQALTLNYEAHDKMLDYYPEAKEIPEVLQLIELYKN